MALCSLPAAGEAGVVDGAEEQHWRDLGIQFKY